MTWTVCFWGARGSIPTPGPATVRYGGNTPCLEVTTSSGARLILDAGTGIRPLGRALESAGPDPVTILLSHTHWDHIQGLPFFGPLYRPGQSVRIIGPAPVGATLDSVIRQQMEPAVFPVPISALAASLAVEHFAGDVLQSGPFAVRALPLCHPCPTLGYRISTGHPGDLCYLTDNEIADWSAPSRRAAIVRFLHRTDTLVHDAMCFTADAPTRKGWGHSTAAEAVSLALEANVRRLVLFHHDPAHDDDRLDRLLSEAQEARYRAGGSLEIVMAAEGLSLEPIGG